MGQGRSATFPAASLPGQRSSGLRIHGGRHYRPLSPASGPRGSVLRGREERYSGSRSSGSGFALSPGRAERHGFEYFRHGTLSLYAALEVSSGQVLGKTAQRHTSAEFVAFLADVVATQSEGKQIHLIADNLSAHKTKAVAEFLAAHTNLQLHYTPTYSSWLNQVEIWFSKIQRALITRGIFTSKADLARKIARYIKAHNKSARPFKWTYRN